jgi:hypothetical protein
MNAKNDITAIGAISFHICYGSVKMDFPAIKPIIFFNICERKNEFCCNQNNLLIFVSAQMDFPAITFLNTGIY